jgi:sugar O-acyltransferase (sialic acid O-acetyltransferase NeuD family)
MKRVVIVGAGAHGREVAEILRHRAQTEGRVLIAGFIDDDRSLWRSTIDELPVLGDWTWFEGVNRDEIAVVCSSGFSETRKQIASRAESYALTFASAISPLAYLSPRAAIGEGVVIYPNATVCRGSSIGNHVLINAGSVVSHDDKLGAYVTLNPGVHLAGNVSVGEGSYLGMGSNVIQGVSIGAWATVGAGAAVISDLPAHVTAVGVPARILGAKDSVA